MANTNTKTEKSKNTKTKTGGVVIAEEEVSSILASDAFIIILALIN